MTAALDLAARGLGDTRHPQRSIRSRGLARQLGGVAVRPAAVRHVRLHHPPQRAPLAATREFMRLAEKRVEALRQRFEAER